MLKVWTGTCWSWIKVRITGRELPPDAEMGSPALVRHGNQWWLHTPIEKQFTSPSKIEKQVTTNAQTKICAVDLNITEHLAVCTIQTVDRNASLVVGQRLVGRYQKSSQEKPPTPRATERVAKATGVVVSQEAKNKEGPSILPARHGDSNEHGTAQDVSLRMVEHISDIPRQLRLFNE